MNFEDRYGWTDRLLYRIAFRSGLAQRTLADVEEALYNDALQATTISDPVFITSLPRAGTTILLRLLWRSGRFATHTYEDMPFVLCPMIWRRFSAQFDSGETVRERAHGDGLTVSERSPEAFEEMIWKHFWPDHYLADRIRPWHEGEHNDEFASFFRTHLRKVIAIHQEDDEEPRRYLSKNNVNIARLAARPAGLQEGTMVIPFRSPLQQAASMLNQHRRFTDLHQQDDFVREYMEAIGHHDFGKGLKPIDFGGWLDESPGAPDDLAFWLRYWVAAYRFVLEHADDSTVLLSYARLTEEPDASLSRLARILDLPPHRLVDQADRLEAPRTHSANSEALPPSLLQTAEALYDELDQNASV